MNLVQMSLTAGILILGIIVFRTLFIHRVFKKVMVLLWEIAILRLVLPIAVPLPFPGIGDLGAVRLNAERFQIVEGAVVNTATEIGGWRVALDPGAVESEGENTVVVSSAKMIDQGSYIFWGIYGAAALALIFGSVYLYFRDSQSFRDEAVKQAGRKVEDILLPENVSPDLDSARLQLSALSEDKKSLQQIRESGGIVTAPFGGVITDILVGTGARTPDTAVMLLSDESLPCQLKVTLDKDQKKYVGLGDQISVRLEGQSKEFEEKVAYLAESRDAAEKYEVLVELPEKMGMPGASGSISRSDPGEKYRLCLPPAAVHEADKQNFVYVLKSREGILGEEYYVDTVNVKVLDQNDNWVAIEEGILDKESRIILSSTKEIAKGETVRWEE